jgi:hypothetical protein
MITEIAQLHQRVNGIKRLLQKGTFSYRRENELKLELHNCELKIELYELKQSYNELISSKSNK